MPVAVSSSRLPHVISDVSSLIRSRGVSYGAEPWGSRGVRWSRAELAPELGARGGLAAVAGPQERKNTARLIRKERIALRGDELYTDYEKVE